MIIPLAHNHQQAAGKPKIGGSPKSAKPPKKQEKGQKIVEQYYVNIEARMDASASLISSMVSAASLLDPVMSCTLL